MGVPINTKLDLLALAPPPEHLGVVAQLLGRQEHPGPPVRRVAREPLDALIDTLLSQQNTSSVARRQFAALKAAYPQWEAALLDGPEGIEHTLRGAGGGLTRTKAGYIHAILNDLNLRLGTLSLRGLRDLDDLQVRAQLEGLPGIGQKTASLLMLFDLGRAAIPVDTNIERLAKRLEWVPAHWNARQVELWFDRVLPRDWAFRQTFHVAGVWHGRTTCRPRHPHCDRCVLRDFCPSAAVLAPGRGAARMV